MRVGYRQRRSGSVLSVLIAPHSRRTDTLIDRIRIGSESTSDFLNNVSVGSMELTGCTAREPIVRSIGVI